MFRCFRATVLAVALGLSSQNALGQTAQVTGRTTDSSGAVLPGAGISIRNVATGAERKVTANEAGYFTLPLLQPGEYSMTVERQGFKPILRKGIVLEVD